ncbi:Phenylalanine-tRNA ligase alpha subunit [Zancudomyces culisetae]|uniref:Probable phenylalanine--tRNA ligase alpha subunit n=1 Tax=Zancudomyces culisetae TaxID=1213189 RepID=A0A1R1PZN7_ZANCU|nr:Phenylalanine-tRNA ligase alpha subunit [Zancudomyces culisetae]|eukprot:OMH86402.1 Phenylalanine-tRNA ligase alpha subunit [Zancudomyces culisetae]
MTMDIQEVILEILDKGCADGCIQDTRKIEGFETVDQLQVLGVLKSLESKEIVKYETIEQEILTLTSEGEEILENGSHEVRLFNIIPAQGMEGLEISKVSEILGASVGKIGQGKAFQNKWIKKTADNKLERVVDAVTDETQKALALISSGSIGDGGAGVALDAKMIKELKRRKLIVGVKKQTYKVFKGQKYSRQVKQEATDLTYEMLQSGSWKDSEFKKFNFNSKGIPSAGGSIHPLLKVMEEFQQIFFEMGFEEMKTDKYVETSFWNFDSLYIPQQHPARESQDTFFIKDPQHAKSLPDFQNLVQQVHEIGGFGSIGYRYPWSKTESQKLVLRTHTTAVSAYMLHKLSKSGRKLPMKLFSIDRVFRNESVDATHLAEFHQVEGVIADKSISLGTLITFMDVFFGKMGIKKLKFKPAYNPYTEPSLEVFSWHEGFQKWVEIGNSGIFRPEMVRALGLEPGVQVIGFGLSLERPTMIKYGINNIRSLVGHKVDINMVKSNPFCRLDKN